MPPASGSVPAGLRIEAVCHVSAPSRFPNARAAGRAHVAGRGRSSRHARPGWAGSECCATRVAEVKLRLLCVVENLFTLDAVTRVCVTPYNNEHPGGVEWVKADWGTEPQATRVSWAGPMPPEPNRSSY